MSEPSKYQITRKLAVGGMAEVFLARAAGPEGFSKTLVLKRILPHFANHERFVEMFLHEARLAAQLNHPHIVQIFDFGREEGGYFIAMELIEGPNLRQLMRRAAKAQLPIPLGLGARIVASVCEGLQYAHDFIDPVSGAPLGLIHRDLSADNVLVSRAGAVKIVDFGIAKATRHGEQTDGGMLKGKVASMAPEQLKPGPLDRRVDVYAAGVLLYELVAGVRPFAADDSLALIHAVLTEEPRPVSSHGRPVPVELAAIIHRAIAKDRDARYGSCDALRADLERYLRASRELATPSEIARLVLQVAAATDGVDDQLIPRTSPSVTASVRVPNPVHPGAFDVTVTEPPSRRSRNGVLAGLAAVCVALGFVVAWGPASHLMARRTLPGAVAVQPPPSPEAPAEPPAVEEVAPPPPAAPALSARVPDPPVDVPAPPATPAPPSPGHKRSHGGVTHASSPRVRAPAPVVPAAAAPAGVASQQVEFRVHPYAEVFVDGRRIGETPLAPQALTEGTHEVKLVNRDLHREVTVHFVVGPDTRLFRYNISEQPR